MSPDPIKRAKSLANLRPRPRVKGQQNKVTGDIKAMILAALDRKGGAAYLEEQAGANPSAFLTLLGRILPPAQAAPSVNVSVGVGLVCDEPMRARLIALREQIAGERAAKRAPLPAVVDGVLTASDAESAP